ncbi:helix-turn-helix domain-containing protein [Synechococcus sp. EJ6-Ellesmere]|nr:helix-turn-helix domain-containing protein [Synechococcus sp. EJ6-Ellesmere]MCP9824675.1 helix-turn-helix domain-containing protein [Synechococcus sp. EJ6-Ellesmere]
MEFTYSTREACKALRISDRTLLRLRRDGVLRPGDHYRAAGAGQHRPTLL